MFSNMMMIVPLFYMWISCSTMNGLTKDYFNRNSWFNHGNIFHIDQEPLWNVFQQHRNVNRQFLFNESLVDRSFFFSRTSINWLANEISSLNHQIKFIKDQATFAIHTLKQRSILPEENIPIKNSSSSTIKLQNHRNTFLLKLLSNEKLFDGYLEDLIDIYQISVSTTIECIAIINGQNSMEKYLFIKLSNGNIDQYQMNKTKSLRKIDQMNFEWKNDGKQPEYYRRFTPENKINEIISTNLLTEIKNRPKLNDANFFDMMGQILRVKYHTDPSSLSCILEVFFGNIYTCDGRMIHPHELKLLSDNNNFFVFYGVMLDTNTEKQIYPLDTNNHIRLGDQIFFLFPNHPQFQSLSSLKCTDCPRTDQAYILNNNEKKIEQTTDNQIVEPKESVHSNLLQYISLPIPQNYIVYFIAATISLYILIGIYLSRQEQSSECSGRKHSISSRRGR